MLLLKLFFIPAFLAGFLTGKSILKRYGRPADTPGLGFKIGLGLVGVFVAFVALAAFVRLTFDIEIYLPTFMRINATHFKWFGVELLFSAFVGFVYGVYYLEPRAMKIRLLITVLILFAAIGCGENHYTRPIFDSCQDRRENGIILQSYPSTCGPASLANLMMLFGKNVCEKDIARIARTRLTGTTGDELAIAARSEEFGMHARYFKVPLEMVEALGLPCVLSFGEVHFVTYIQRRGHLYEYIDPSTGLLMAKKNDLIREWDGKSLFVFDEKFDFRMTPGESGREIIPIKKALAKIYPGGGETSEIKMDEIYDPGTAALVDRFRKDNPIAAGTGLEPYINLLILARASARKYFVTVK